MKFAYCGYDFFYTCLEGLIADGHELAELFTYPTDNEYDFNDNVTRLARSARARITLSSMTTADFERLKASGVEIIISAAYPYKIPDWRSFVRYAVNIHPSNLPEGRGPWPLPWVILKGLRETAVTIHEVGTGWDDGDVIAQTCLPVLERETLESLSLRSQIAAQPLLCETLRNIDTLWTAKRPQGAGGSYWKMPQNVDRTIDWSMDIYRIDTIVRAFSKFEPFLFIDGARHFVRKVDVWPETHSHAPGTLVHRSNRERVYAARDGYVCLSHYVTAAEG